jgi:ribosomal protein S18 acetylase RimI-like enzyme
MDSFVEAIERATFAAVPPQRLLELPGWLAGLDDGTVGRAHSAVPLQHGPAPQLPLHALEAAYAAQGLQPVFRLPRTAPFEPLARELAAAGYAPTQPTVVQTATLPLSQGSGGVVVELKSEPDAAWARLFLGATANAADAVSRLGILRRAQETVYASVQAPDGALAAVGVCHLAHGWCGIHGMRTAAPWRGHGFATAILDAFERQAQAQGVRRAFLQVEEANTTAQSVYRRAGFGTAWAYTYWRRAGA